MPRANVPELRPQPAARQHSETTLKQLQAADLVRRSEDRDLVTYRANPASPIFAELRGIVEKTSGIDGVVREALLAAGRKIRLALIYGSVAKGTNRAGSDLDVLVVGDIGFDALVRLLQPAEERIRREISPRLYSWPEFRKKRSTDRFLKSTLAGPTTALIGNPHGALEQ